MYAYIYQTYIHACMDTYTAYVRTYIKYTRKYTHRHIHIRIELKKNAVYKEKTKSVIVRASHLGHSACVYIG